MGQEGPFSVACSPAKPQEHIWDLSSCGYLYPHGGSLGPWSPKPRPPVGKVGVAWGMGPRDLERTTSLPVSRETSRFAPREAVRAAEIPPGLGGGNLGLLLTSHGLFT